MENKRPLRAVGALSMLLGGLVIAVPRWIFPACGRGPYAPPPGFPIGKHGCDDTVLAETIVGIVVAVLGLVCLVRPSRRLGTAAGIALIALALLIILFPTMLTGMCRLATMPCRLGTSPGLVGAGIGLAAAGVAALVWSRREH